MRTLWVCIVYQSICTIQNLASSISPGCNLRAYQPPTRLLTSASRLSKSCKDAEVRSLRGKLKFTKIASLAYLAVIVQLLRVAEYFAAIMVPSIECDDYETGFPGSSSLAMLKPALINARDNIVECCHSTVCITLAEMR